MASLNLAGKTSGYVKLTAPDDSSTNPTVILPTESGELALKSDIGEGGGGSGDSATLESLGIPNHDQIEVDSDGHLLIGESGWNGGASNKKGLAIQATSSESSPFAMYITNSNNNQIFSVRCDGSSRTSKLYLGDDKVDLRAELNLKDKLIEKLSERLDKLEAKLKK